jgi:hypothetical protein
MTAKKRRPEFELGPLLINQVQEYFGTRSVNKLTNDQAANIARLCNECASVIGKVIEDLPPTGPIPRHLEHSPADNGGAE